VGVVPPPGDVVAQLQNAVRVSQRKTSVRLPQAFLRDLVGAEPDPPLARVMQGHGETRLKVLLTTLMMATAAPHAIKVRPTELAGMLGFREPAGAGARRVNSAFKSLEELNLVQRDRKPGRVPNTAILNPDGSGSAWDDTKLEPGHYVSLPIDLWRRGWIVALSGRAIALFVILREATGGRATTGTAWLPGTRKRQYALSDDFWADATSELVAAGLLDVEAKTFSYQGEPRRRNVYILHSDRVQQFDPGSAPGGRYNGIHG